MSKLLKKILRAAVFPASLMIVSKVAGIYLLTKLKDLEWAIQTNIGNIFSVKVVYPDFETALAVNSFSNLIMYAAILIGVGILLFQAYFLHNSHQDPKVLVKLIQFDFILWLIETKTLFPKLSVWLAFLWTATILILTQAIQSETHAWVAYIALPITIISTWLAARDFEREVHTFLPENGKLEYT